MAGCHINLFVGMEPDTQCACIQLSRFGAVPHTLPYLQLGVPTTVNELHICLAAVVRKPPLSNSRRSINNHFPKSLAEDKARRILGC